MEATEMKFTCPNCGSDKVTLTEVRRVMANTLEHWCFSVKPHDKESSALCVDCWWEGTRADLAGANA